MSKVNLLALPKRKEFLCNFLAPDGRLLVRDDVSSLEPSVLAHLSQDKNLLSIYGKNAKPQDGYLFVASFIYPEVEALYDKDNPTKEMILHVKSECKEFRDRIKPVLLGWFYGLQANTLSISENIPFKEAYKLIRHLDDIFPGKQRLHNALISQMMVNGWYIINGRGRPLPIPSARNKQKDIVNRDVQSTGHDLLQRIIFHRNNYRKQHNIDMKPYIPDWHDEGIWSIHPDELDRYIDAVNYSYDMLNKELNWTVTIKHGGITVGKDLSIRCE